MAYGTYPAPSCVPSGFAANLAEELVAQQRATVHMDRAAATDRQLSDRIDGTTRAARDLQLRAKAVDASIADKLNSQVDSMRQAADNLEASLEKVRACHRDQLMLLKALELERTDRQLAGQRLTASRQDWQNKHNQCGLQANASIGDLLAAEERAAHESVRTVDQHVALVSSQVMRLKEVKKALERKLVQKRSFRDVVEGSSLPEYKVSASMLSSMVLSSRESSCYASAYDTPLPHRSLRTPRQAPFRPCTQ